MEPRAHKMQRCYRVYNSRSANAWNLFGKCSVNDLATCRVFIEILAPIPEFRQPAVRQVNTTAKSYAREMEGSLEHRTCMYIYIYMRLYNIDVCAYRLCMFVIRMRGSARVW